MTTSNAPHRAGRHFLHIPGPTPVPDRILRAIDQQVIDHRGPEFQALAKSVLSGIKTIFKTTQPVIIYPASGTGAWESALVNTLSPGDHVLMVETGQFASLWHKMATKLGLVPQLIETDWRSGVDASVIEAKLLADTAHTIKAVCVVHSETSTGVLSNIAAVRQAMNRANHPALLMVDTISSLASADFRHDEWGIDVTIGGSQKGLMLPPGLSFTAISAKALEASKTAKLPRAFWAWDEMLTANESGFFPYTPATSLLYGLQEAIKMLHEEGLDNVFARHVRHGEAARRAVAAWGLTLQCANPAEYSPVLTTVQVPAGSDADYLREVALKNFDLSLGMGLARLKGKVFRIGHLGDCNDLSLMAALSGVEMSLALAGIPHKKGGVDAAMAYLVECASKPAAQVGVKIAA
ncbi:MAG: pyridoxal-phosphate-dependent aminotransferase family protein [Burkholderiales bacterium]|jgi:alanine-glyoxylate transaminase/serine-glyoxylate transaminase/serine-pyruvate transaminase|nr:aminotransferase class V-fold PLP-dependent enzyme [Betaproteobacteria bacterium]